MKFLCGFGNNKDNGLLAIGHDINTKPSVLYDIQKVENQPVCLNILKHSILYQKCKVHMGGKELHSIPGYTIL